MITSSAFLKIIQTSNHTEFYDYLKMIVLDKKKRENFFKAILSIHWDLSVDFFRDYFIQNSQNDFMAFSGVNILPRTESVTKKFNVKEWLRGEVRHIESPLMEKSEMRYEK